MKSWLGITWGISNRYGWGVYGINLVRELLKRGRPTPVCFEPISLDTLSPALIQELQPVINFQKENLSKFHRSGKIATLKDSIVLHALGNEMELGLLSKAFEGEVNIGMIFFEYTEVSPDALARARNLDLIVAGSTWNADVMKGWGLTNVDTVFQGIDTSLFRPLPRKKTYDGKFAIFSGGKLDFRKGQDIVLEAFKKFSQRHDDVILVTAWHNLWPLTALPFIFSPYTDRLPKIQADDMLNMKEWAASQGVAPDKFVDLGMLRNEDMPQILNEMDLAIFPNRCEGGTNLVAMETMACGVPCVLSANTGHLDLIGDDAKRCYPLMEQGPVSLPECGVDGWGESSVDELIEKMESAYQNRDQARQIGEAGADFMRGWSWSNQIAKLVDILDRY